MAAFVTENWSGKFLSLKAPWTAQFEYCVSGTFNEAVALAAVPYQINDPHPYNTLRMFCEGPYVKEVKGPEFFVVVCPFSVPPAGRFPDQPPDPLDLQPRIWWETCELLEPVDRDLVNRLICNSAGDIQTASRRITYKRLVIVKNLPFYDIQLSKAFENTVNADVVSLSSTVTCAAEHMRCAIIEPAEGGYVPDVPFMPMKFVFDIMADVVLGKYPWQHRLLDAGRNGWYGSGTNNASGIFTNGKEAADFDVKLDGTGKPLTYPYGTGAGAIKVGNHSGNTSNSPTTPPHPFSSYKTEYYENGTIKPSLGSNTDSVFRYFQACKAVDFTPLLDLL